MQNTNNLLNSSIICDSGGKCRCCLALGKHQCSFGNAELEILMENLNLFLLADPRLPNLICQNCSKTLSEVVRFRQLVLASETELLKAITEEIRSDNERLDAKRTDLGIKTEILVDENHRHSEELMVKREPNCESQDMSSNTDTGNNTEGIQIKSVKSEYNSEKLKDTSSSTCQIQPENDTQASPLLKRNLPPETDPLGVETIPQETVDSAEMKIIIDHSIPCGRYRHRSTDASGKKAKRYCIAYGCFNNDVNTQGKEISFFRLPVDIERCREWLTLLDRDDLLAKEDFKPVSYLVCSTHFKDFEYRRILKTDTLPVKSARSQPQDNSQVLCACMQVKAKVQKKKHEKVESMKKAKKGKVADQTDKSDALEESAPKNILENLLMRKS